MVTNWWIILLWNSKLYLKFWITWQHISWLKYVIALATVTGIIGFGICSACDIEHLSKGSGSLLSKSKKTQQLKVRWSVSDLYYFGLGTLQLECVPMVTFVCITILGNHTTFLCRLFWCLCITVNEAHFISDICIKILCNY